MKEERQMGKRKKRRSSKEIKGTLKSKQKENVNPVGSLVFRIQHKGICCCNDMKDNFKTILGYLETHLFGIHLSYSKMIVVAIGNMYITTTTFFLKGVHIVLRFFQNDLHIFWCRHRCMFLINWKTIVKNYNFPSFFEYLISYLFFLYHRYLRKDMFFVSWHWFTLAKEISFLTLHSFH